MVIHKTAIIADGAELHETVEVEPYAVIGPNVKIGAGTRIGPHAIIDGHTVIGENSRVFAGASIGLEPQDLSYKGEPTGVIIGNNTVIREYVTIHRGVRKSENDPRLVRLLEEETLREKLDQEALQGNVSAPVAPRTVPVSTLEHLLQGNTVVGDNCFLMNYVHVAHNCRLGNGVIMANGTMMAGHVDIGDGTVFSGVCILHQHVRVGRFCMIGGMTGTRVDLPPFTICDGRPAMVRGLNVIGLRRGKMNPPTRACVKQAYKLLYRSGLNYSQAIARIKEELEPGSEIQEICEFFSSSKRGVAPAFGDYAEGKREHSEFEEAPIDSF